MVGLSQKVGCYVSFAQRVAKHKFAQFKKGREHYQFFIFSSQVFSDMFTFFVVKMVAIIGTREN